jgi:hypothetical protein
MAGHKPVEDGRKRPDVPAIHVLLREKPARKTWRSRPPSIGYRPGMTKLFEHPAVWRISRKSGYRFSERRRSRSEDDMILVILRRQHGCRAAHHRLCYDALLLFLSI